MSIDQDTLARRLREAREAAGLTQEDAARELGVPRTAVVQLEAGKRAVSSLELVRLARLYDRRIDSFFEESPQAADQHVPVSLYYRAAVDVDGSPETQAHLTAIIELCRIGVELDILLGRRARFVAPTYAVSEPTRKLEAVEQGCQAANEERRRLELGDAPIANMADLLSGQDIWASAAPFPDHVSGLFMNDPELGVVILVNQDHGRARQRFSYAHEFAHSLFDRNRPVTVSKFENRAELAEVRANAFAAAFLMPPRGVEVVLRHLDKGTPSRSQAWVYDLATEVGKSPVIQAEERAAPGSQTITCKDVALLAQHFGVSYQAAAYRIRNLDWINQNECEELIKQEQAGRDYLALLNLMDYDKPDPQPDRELRNQIAYRAVEAYRREEISRGRVLELSKLLGIPGQKVLRLATQSGPA